MPRYVLRYDAREFHARLPRRAAPRFLVRLLALDCSRDVATVAAGCDCRAFAALHTYSEWPYRVAIDAGGVHQLVAFNS